MEFSCPSTRKSVKIVIFLTVFVLAIVGLQNITNLNELNGIVNTLVQNNFCQSSQLHLQTIETSNMTPQQIMEYLIWPNRSSCSLTHDFGGSMKKNPSGLDGQKAVCLEPVQVAPPSKDCLVYSFGISYEWSFDEAMANYGCQVYAFDPSMNMEDHDHTPAIHFFKLGLGSQNSTTGGGWRILTLPSIYQMLKPRHGDRTIDYLKMDIEYSEWGVIPQMVESGLLNKIRQLAMEVHFNSNLSLEQMRNQMRILRSIEENGMIRFDSKRNPWTSTRFSSLNQYGSTAYEIAWYNSKFLTSKQ